MNGLVTFLVLVVGVSVGVVSILPTRQLYKNPQPELPELPPAEPPALARCRDCPHTWADHSHVLMDSPCLECSCYAWVREPAEDPMIRLARVSGELVAATTRRHRWPIHPSELEPPGQWWARITNKTPPRTASLRFPQPWADDGLPDDGRVVP